MREQRQVDSDDDEEDEDEEDEGDVDSDDEMLAGLDADPEVGAVACLPLAVVCVLRLVPFRGMAA